MQELVARHPSLRELNVWYREQVPRLALETHVYYEKKPTKGILIVDEASADPGITGCVPIPLDEDHITICKPRDKQAQVYQCVKQLVARLCQAATNFPDPLGIGNRFSTAEIPALPPISAPVEAEQAVFEKNLRRAIVTELDKPSLLH